MKKNKVLIGTGIGSALLSGLGILMANKVLDKVSTENTNSKLNTTLIDFAVSKKSTITAKAAWSNPTDKKVFSGYEYVLVTLDNYKSAKAWASELGVTVAQLKTYNSSLVFNQWDYPYPGTLLFYKINNPTNDPSYYTKLAENGYTEINTSNWKSIKSIDRPSYAKMATDRGSGSPDATGKNLGYAINENANIFNGTDLTLSGWAAQVNYSDTNSINHDTKIVITNENTTDVVKLQDTTKTSVNPKANFYWGILGTEEAGTKTYKCPDLDAYLDTSIGTTSYTYFNSTKSLAGCYRDYANSGFTTTIDTKSLFKEKNYKKSYDLYIVNSTGKDDANRIIYSPLSLVSYIDSPTDTTITNNEGEVLKYTGKIKLRGNKSTDTGSQVTMGYSDIIMRISPYPTNTEANYINGSPMFEIGTYSVIDKTFVDTNLWYKIKATINGTTYTGWVQSYYVINADISPANLALKVNSVDYSVNYTSADSEDKGKIIASIKQTITNGESSTVTPRPIYYDGNIKWRLVDSTTNPKNVKTTQTLTDTNLETIKNINYTYTKNKEVKINYINANTGEKINSTDIVKDVKYGTSGTFTYNDTNILKEIGGTYSSNGLITIGGKTYKYAGDGVANVTNNLGTKLNINTVTGASVDKYKNANTQTRAYLDANDTNALDEVNFYVYEPQDYTVYNVRADGNNNMLKSDGTKTTSISEANIVSNPNKVTYFTEDSLKINAYGINGKTITSAFGDYRYAGRAKFETSSLLSSNTQTDSTTDDYKLTRGYLDTRLGITLLKNTNKGNYSVFYYRKSVNDPSKIDTNVNGESTASTTGQNNWYLGRDSETNNSKLYTSLNSTIDDNIVAVSSVVSTITYAKDGTSETIATSNPDKNKTTIPYYFGNITNNSTIATYIGDTDSTTTQYKDYNLYNNSAYNSKYNRITSNSENIKSLSFNTLAQNTALTDYVYKGSQSDLAGKGGKVSYSTKFDYYTDVYDHYKSSESFNGVTFVWTYDYSEPIDKKTYTYTSTANIDHKVNEDSDSLTKVSDKLVSKIGFLHNYTGQKAGSVLTTESTANSKKLNETITKTKTNSTNLKSQTTVNASEEFTYQTDLTSSNNYGGLVSMTNNTNDTSATRENQKYKSQDKFIYNSSLDNLNKYYMVDTDKNFREVTSSNSEKNNLRTKVNSTISSLDDLGSLKYQTGVKASSTKTSTGYTIKTDLSNYYGVMSDTGLLYEGTNSQNKAETYYKSYTGYSASDSDKLIGTNNTYYIPIDGESTLTPNKTYTNRTILSKVGLSQRNVAIDTNFKFEKYLVGESTDNSVYASYKASLVKSGSYSTPIIITADEASTIDSSITNNTKDGFRTMNIKEMIQKMSEYLNF